MSEHFEQRGWRLLRWFFGAPFRAMSDAIGDPVPPEVQVFEARLRKFNGSIAVPAIGCKWITLRPKH